MDTIHFLIPFGAASKILLCMSAGSWEYIGRTRSGFESVSNCSIFSANTEQVPSMSSCPVIKIRISTFSKEKQKDFSNGAQKMRAQATTIRLGWYSPPGGELK